MTLKKPLLLALFLLSSILSFYHPPTALAADFPTGFEETLFVTGLTSPTTMAFAPDGRLFITEQGGTLRVVKNGQLLPQPFLTVSVDSTQERGLLGVAFHPDFLTNQYVYIYYTTSTEPKRNIVSRFTANGDIAAAGSEQVILELDNLSAATNHNGGALQFGPDGRLYIGVGDNANSSNSQSLETLHGKILRINPDGSIPADNPFVDQTSGKNQAIWAWGLRNPYNFTFDFASSRMMINDVGQNTWEEINAGIAGANYGWPATEGETTQAGYTSPLYAYGHDGDPLQTGCSIVGAAFYDPPALRFPAEYIGDYFFADFCADWIKHYDPVTDAVTQFGFSTIERPVDLRISDEGDLYYLARGSGEGEGAVYRVTVSGTGGPAGDGLVISQVYGGGGNAGASFRDDFVELFNASSSAIDITGWTLQYSPINQTTWQAVNLPNRVIQPGQYYLIQFNGGAIGALLPPADYTANLGIATTSARLAIVRTAALLTGTDPIRTDVEDFVGYGTTSAYEGSGTAPGMADNATAILRLDGGCTDTDDNSADFNTASPPTPRNTSTISPCSGVTITDNAPAVSFTAPATNAADVPVDSDIVITFSEPVTVNGAWYTLSCAGSGPIMAAVSGSWQTYTLNPNSALGFEDTCTVTVVAAQVVDRDGTPTPMTANYTWNFTTAADDGSGDTAPQITDTTPADNATNVATDANIAVNFDEPVTVNPGAFTLTCSTSGTISTVISGGPQSYLINPDTGFFNGETCTVTAIAAQIADQDGTPDAMTSNVSWQFIVVDAPPQVVNVSPANNALDVPITTNIGVTFSEAVTFPASAFTVNCSSSGSVNAALSGAGKSYVIDPAAPLTNEETCMVTLIAAQISDLDGTSSLNMPSDFVWQFATVAADVADSAPSVTSHSPASGATAVPVNSTLEVTFSEDVVTTEGWYSIACTGSGSISATVTGGPQNFTLTLGSPLLPEETCFVTILAAEVSDLDGTMQTMTADYSWSFSTVTIGSGDVPPQVNVNALSPAPDAIGVALNAPVIVAFTEDVTVSGDWFSIGCSSSGNVSASVTGGPRAYTLTPGSPFAHAESCTVTLIASQVQDTDTPPKPLGEDFSWQFTTIPDSSVCGTDFTPIYTLQGSGSTTTFSGTVTTEGIITGDFEGNTPQTLGGFYLQAPSPGDSDPATSDGIFVSHPGIDAVSVGDYVRVIGTIQESSGQTRLSNPAVIPCPANGTVTPTTISLPYADAATLERYEGMWITFTQQLTVTDTSRLGQYGEVWLASGGRLFAPTQMTAPGTEATAQQAANERNRLLLGDASSTQYPDPTPYLFDGSTLRLGDTVTGLTGILGFSFTDYRLHPTTAPAFVRAHPRSIAPAVPAGSLRVASMNLENYFNGPIFPTTRGADTPEEFARQREKVINALLALNADIIGLIEMENDGYGPDSAIQDLVNGLNALSGAGSYAFIAPEFSLGTDFVNVALIYRPGTVRPIGAAQTTTQAPFDNNSRSPLAQTFEQVSTGERLTVVVAHFKSKICGSDATGANADQGDGQGCWNAERTQAANTLLRWLALDPTKSFDADTLILGDLNAYAMEDPITAFKNAGYVDLVAQASGSGAYSHVFEGQSGTLDYALANPALAAQASGATLWHINADEPDMLDYNQENKSAAQQALNTGTPFRSSDHDPVLVSLNLQETFGAELTWIAPLGSINTGYGNPVYQWSRVQDATEYQLYIAPSLALSQPVLHEIIPSEGVCIGAVCSIDMTTIEEAFRLVNGAYTVYARAWKGPLPGAWGPSPGAWVGPFGFVLDAPPPQAITLDSLTSMIASRPTYTWQLADSAANASWFRVYLAPQQALTVPLFDQWVSRASACGDVHSTTCAYTAPVDLLNGAYALYIGSWGPGGFSIGGTSGYAGVNFNVTAQPAATPAGLTLTVNQGRPALRWVDDPHTSWYRVSITPNGADPLVDQWHLKADLGCMNGPCTLIPDTNLTNGAYTVSLAAWGPAGFNPTPATTALNLNFSTPAAVTGMTTTNANSGQPTFTWQGVPGTTWYLLWVGTRNFETYHLDWHLAADLGCENAGLCTVTPPIELLNGAHTWYVRGWGPGGFSLDGIEGWAQGAPFSVDAPAALLPTLITPDGLTNKVNPTFTWTHTVGVRWYHLRIDTLDPLQPVHQQWHSADSLTCADDGLCSFHLTAFDLPLGDYVWTLQAYTPAGISEWSSYQAFKVFR